MWVYAGLLTLLALLSGALVLPTHGVTDPWPLVALLVLTLVLSNLAVELPFSVSLSFTFAPVFAGILLAGPVGGALLGAASAISFQEIRERKPLVLMLVNLSQLFLAGLAAGWVLVALGGGPMPGLQAVSTNVGGALLAPFLAVVSCFVVNLLLVGIAFALKTGMGWRDTIRVLNPGAYWISLLVLALLGYVMAHLMNISSWLGLLLLVLPFAMARRTFRVFVELSEAYTATVRSLVAAIEAKDPYTRGHSERVAIYARRLAEVLGLPHPDVDALERAALLHDVGKIGIELRTLTSPNELPADEVRQIREHPALGVEILEDVEFLADIVPVVRHHHERIDGAGYPDGLAGAEIPVLARVLAVADSHDAMTSDRAYRSGMSEDQAVVEMMRVSGTQLDEQMVRRFIELLGTEQLEATP
jgi:putative nucleotidyltransferase with HDIG domain